MANVASGVYPQMLHSTATGMVVPTPYHYHHQPQHTQVNTPPVQPVQHFLQVHEPKKDTKKKGQKVSEKDKKKRKTTINNIQNPFSKDEVSSTQNNGYRIYVENNCVRCNKKKCCKHNDIK